MLVMGEAALLRIYIGDDDTYADQPLSEALLTAARCARMAGVTVLRGIAGYGRSAHLHETFRGFANDLPIVVEIIDSQARIDAWLPSVEDMLGRGIAVIETVKTVRPTGQ
jgi:uncharacterized protein